MPSLPILAPTVPKGIKRIFISEIWEENSGTFHHKAQLKSEHLPITEMYQSLPQRETLPRNFKNSSNPNLFGTISSACASIIAGENFTVDDRNVW